MNSVSRDTFFVTTLASERPAKLAPACKLREFVRYARDCVAIVVLMTGTTDALAQSARSPNPGDPEASVPALKYESTFSDYFPFREQKSNSWKQVNKEVADNPGMGPMSSMNDMAGKSMPGMESKTAGAPMTKKGADGHAMDSMKDVPDDAMPGMDSKSAGEAMSEKDHESMSTAHPQTAAIQAAGAQASDITGTGVVQVIDKANGKVKLSHEPIAVLGWPKMTMFFRLKDSSLADQVKEGEKVEFSLEKSASGYVISGWHRSMAVHDMKKMK